MPVSKVLVLERKCIYASCFARFWRNWVIVCLRTIRQQRKLQSTFPTRATPQCQITIHSSVLAKLHQQNAFSAKFVFEYFHGLLLLVQRQFFVCLRYVPRSELHDRFIFVELLFSTLRKSLSGGRCCRVRWCATVTHGETCQRHWLIGELE